MLVYTLWLARACIIVTPPRETRETKPASVALSFRLLDHLFSLQENQLLFQRLEREPNSRLEHRRLQIRREEGITSRIVIKLTTSCTTRVTRGSLWAVDVMDPEGMSRKILNVTDMQHWMSCPAYQDYMSFLRQLNDAAKSCYDLLDRSHFVVTDPLLLAVESLLSKTLSALVNEIEPLESDTTQRFGNKSFRVWYESMTEGVDYFFNEDQKEFFSEEDVKEMSPYLTDSFGNRQRIDYGTGHEMNFIIFLMGLFRLKLPSTTLDRRPSSASTASSSCGDASSSSDAQQQPIITPSTKSKEVALCLSRQILIVFSESYLPLVRKIQLRYTLEPAGSHGVYSLDDFQFLPFVWGSSQLSHHPRIEPSNFPEKEEAEQYSSGFMFHAAIKFIHDVKNGPFAEHSNQLWNISAVEGWEKINRGLLKMYADEVLHKFPVVQHLVFGPRIFRWSN